MKFFIFLVIFAFQCADFGQTQVTIKSIHIPSQCECFREWFEDRADFFATENPKKLAKKIFNSWNTIENDSCISYQEYKNNQTPKYCGGVTEPGYLLYDFIDNTNSECLTKKKLKKALKKIKRFCL